MLNKNYTVLNNFRKNKANKNKKFLYTFFILNMLIISIFSISVTKGVFIQNNNTNDASDNIFQRNIIPTGELGSKLLSYSDMLTIDDPTGQIEGYSINQLSGLIELNSSRGQSYRHYYNTSNQKYAFESDSLVIKPDVIDGTDWVTFDEFPISFFIRTNTNETIYASTPAEASTILAGQEQVYCVGIETFVGSSAFYINPLDNDWAHGQTVFYPRLSTGNLPELDNPLYSWFAHLFVQKGENQYDKIINDNSFFPAGTSSPVINFDLDNDYYKIWYALSDITAFSQIFDITVGIKYSLIDGKFHTINNVTCKTTDFDDIGFSYDIFCSSLDKLNPISPLIQIENNTMGYTIDLTEEMLGESILNNYSSSFSLIDENNEGFSFDYSDMELSGFTKKILLVNNQTMPNGDNFNVLRVGMEGYGEYTKNSRLEIDPTFQKLMIDEWDVSLNYISGTGYSKQTGKNRVGYVDGEFGLPDISSKFFMLWDTGLSGNVTATSSVELRIKCYSEQLESGEKVKFILLADYSYLRPVESDSAGIVDDYWSSSAYGNVYHTPSAGTTTNLNVETLTDYWASNKEFNSIIKFRIEAGTGMDSGTNDLVQYYDGGDSTSINRPRLKFSYTMINPYIINGDFEDNDSGLLDPDDSLIGWNFESDNGGDYYIISDGTNKYLKIINYDSANSNGIYNQTIDFNFDEDGVIVSGDLRLKLSGKTSSQRAYIKYYFYNSNFNELGYVTFYISEDDQTLSNNSTDIVFNLSPFEADSASWTTSYDTGWISFRVDLKEIFENADNLTTLDDENERNNIAYAKVITKLYTTSSNSTEAMFDNVSLSSIHLARDATRKMNIYHSDYADMIDDIEYDIYTDYGDFPTTKNISRAIYDYLRTYDYENEATTDSYLDLELIQVVQDELKLPSDCAQQAIMVSAFGRIFGIKTRLVRVLYEMGTTDHVFSEFYWNNSWHMVDTHETGYFDNGEDFHDYIEDKDPGYAYIFYDCYIADDPRTGSSYAKQRLYANNPYT